MTTMDLPTSDSPPRPTPIPMLAEKDVRLWSMLCHLSGLAALLIPSFGGVLGPLVLWLIKRNDHPTIDANGKEALNFQLSVLLYTWALLVVGFGTLFILIGFAFIALAIFVSVVALIFAVVAAVKASNGEAYRYPLTIRFIS